MLSTFCEVGGVSIYWKKAIFEQIQWCIQSLGGHVHICVYFSDTQQGLRNKFMKIHVWECMGHEAFIIAKQQSTHTLLKANFRIIKFLIS